MSIYHTICANCDYKHIFIQNNLKSSSRCNSCGSYLYDSYDEICNYLDQNIQHNDFCEICYQINSSKNKKEYYNIICELCNLTVQSA